MNETTVPNREEKEKTLVSLLREFGDEHLGLLVGSDWLADIRRTLTHRMVETSVRNSGLRVARMDLAPEVWTLSVLPLNQIRDDLTSDGLTHRELLQRTDMNGYEFVSFMDAVRWAGSRKPQFSASTLCWIGEGVQRRLGCLSIIDYPDGTLDLHTYEVRLENHLKADVHILVRRSG